MTNSWEKPGLPMPALNTYIRLLTRFMKNTQPTGREKTAIH